MGLVNVPLGDAMSCNSAPVVTTGPVALVFLRMPASMASEKVCACVAPTKPNKQRKVRVNFFIRESGDCNDVFSQPADDSKLVIACILPEARDAPGNRPLTDEKARAVGNADRRTKIGGAIVPGPPSAVVIIIRRGGGLIVSDLSVVIHQQAVPACPRGRAGTRDESLIGAGGTGNEAQVVQRRVRRTGKRNRVILTGRRLRVKGGGEPIHDDITRGREGSPRSGRGGITHDEISGRRQHDITGGVGAIRPAVIVKVSGTRGEIDPSAQ